MNNITITDVRANKGDSAFLIDDGKTTILYDTGFAFTGYSVARNIKDILGTRKLDYIFLTHSHYDHAAGSAYIKKYWQDAKVVAGEYAAKIFAKPTAKALMRQLDQKFAKKCGVDSYEDLIDELKVDIAVSDADIIKAGDMEFVAVELPGHTRCSVGYYCQKHNLLLGCETLGVYNGSDDVVPSYLVGYEMTLKSIDKAQNLGAQHILVPHYGILNGEKALFYLKKGKESAVTTAHEVTEMLKKQNSKQEIYEFFKDKFYHGYIKEIYPIDAMKLNVGITIDLLEKELLM